MSAQPPPPAARTPEEILERGIKQAITFALQMQQHYLTAALEAKSTQVRNESMADGFKAQVQCFEETLRVYEEERGALAAAHREDG
jgi:hypothetical protein